MLDLIVRGGTIVTVEGRRQVDLGVEAGKIAQLGGSMQGRREIDASGLWVLPGGIDPHVHLSDPLSPPGECWVDDFTSGSEAALAGGITTVGNMSFMIPGETLRGAVARESELARGQAIADVV